MANDRGLSTHIGCLAVSVFNMFWNVFNLNSENASNHSKRAVRARGATSRALATLSISQLQDGGLMMGYIYIMQSRQNEVRNMDPPLILYRTSRVRFIFTVSPDAKRNSEMSFLLSYYGHLASRFFVRNRRRSCSISAFPFPLMAAWPSSGIKYLRAGIWSLLGQAPARSTLSGIMQ